jgi:drug/metabolite transporter (DMT)-like permease
VYSPADLLRTPTGFAVGLGNGLAFSLYTLLGRSMARTGRRDPLTGLFYSFGFAAIGLVALGLVANGPRLFDLHLDLKGWLLLGGLALGPTLGSYALFNSSLKILPATLAILITTLEPPLVAVLASVLIGRAVKGVQWLGIGLIVAGVVAVQLGMRRDSAAIGEPELAEGFK